MILITGASGFVSQAVLRCLNSRQGVTVNTLSRQRFNSPCPVNQFITDFTQCNEQLEVALKGVDTVIHLAARAHLLNDTVEDPLACFRSVNVRATINLAKKAAAAGVRRFIFISTIGVYGNTSDTPFTESSEVNPHSDYALSKLEAERQLVELSRLLNFELVIIRPVLVYGAGAPGNFGKLVSLTSRLPVLPFGLCRNRRSFISVDNLAEFIYLCATHPDAANEDFVIADDPPVSIKVLTDTLATALGRSLIQIPIPTRLMELTAKLLGKQKIAEQLLSDLEVDCSKAQRLLGWSSPETMQNALSNISAD